jgi:hypothetical protein
MQPAHALPTFAMASSPCLPPPHVLPYVLPHSILGKLARQSVIWPGPAHDTHAGHAKDWLVMMEAVAWLASVSGCAVWLVADELGQLRDTATNMPAAQWQRKCVSSHAVCGAAVGHTAMNSSQSGHLIDT